MKYKSTSSMINIKLQLSNVSDMLREFIFDNINYRRHAWNDFVEESRKYRNLAEFNSYKFHTIYTHSNLRKYDDYYCEYVDTKVSRDISSSIQRCIRDSKKDGKEHLLRFKRFDKYFGSFTVNTRPTDRKLVDGTTRFNTRTVIVDSRTIRFRAHRKLKFDLRLIEDLFYDYEIIDNDIFYNYRMDKGKLNHTVCKFRERDIKEITFIHEIGNFYIQLSVCALFINKLSKINKRKLVAGIDLGIRNPITIYDGDSYIHIKLSNREIKYIKYLESRIQRLQIIMYEKYKRNKARGIYPYSKNYERVRLKFRKTYKKICNIRDNWMKKVSKIIVTKYKNIVVDNFYIPGDDEHKNMRVETEKQINSLIRFHGMCNFMRYLKYTAIKYGTNYIDAKPKTTRTCSQCKHENPRLNLETRIFICDKCGYTIDRDDNAAMNCYNQFY